MTEPDHGAVATHIDELADELVALRRDLHAHPEPSWEEHRSTAVVADRLRAAGLEPRPSGAATGLVCDVGAAGPLVALRADLDALRMVDAKEVAYRSTAPGVCHACGHDVHTAAAVGAALALARVLDPSSPGAAGGGRVRMIFQPAEEAVPSGAPRLVAAGAMDDVDAIFALHCDPAFTIGEVGLRAGAVTSAADMVEIRLRGPGGHTARPYRTADLVHIAARVAVELPMTLSRLSDPRDGVNLTFGAIQAGDAANVIPTEATLRGSLRALQRSGWETAAKLLPGLLAATVEPLGATWELDHRPGAPPVENNPWATALAERAVRAVVGDGVRDMAQSTGGEDFSWYLDHAPGCFVRLGVSAPDAVPVDIHAGAFDVDERSIAIGARVLASMALEAIDALARPVELT